MLDIQGTVDIDSKVPGFTMFCHKETLYRAHPSYSGSGPWFDWAYFAWEGLDELIPCKMYMFLDLRNCNIKDHTTNNDDNLLDGENRSFLTKDFWAVVSAAIEGEAPYFRNPVPRNQRTREYQILPVLNDNHFQSRIAERVFMNKELWFQLRNQLLL